jgi:hypothetical protein
MLTCKNLGLMTRNLIQIKNIKNDVIRYRSSASISVDINNAGDNNATVLKQDLATDVVKPFSQVPGPKGLPIIGNSWRFLPLIGKFLFILMF